MSGEQKRTYYLDYLRIMATFAVIVLHIAAQNWYIAPIESFEWKVYNWYDSAVRWQVPVFVMISGALFLNEKKQVTVKGIFTKSILRMCIAYLFWSVIYNIDLIRAGVEPKAVINAIISGYVHFWYMPMAMGLYLLVPLLKCFTGSKKMEEYFLAIGFILGFLLPRAADLLYTIPETSSCFLLPKLSELMLRLDFRFAAGYVYYFVLGHYLSRIEIRPLYYRLIYLLGIGCIVATALLTDWFSMRVGSPSEKYYVNFTMFTHFAAVAVFVFGRCTLSKIMFKARCQNIIAFVSKCCFGIYLMHFLVINKINQYFAWNSTTWNPSWNIVALSIVVFSVSLLISAVIHKIPILKKYIV